jgi:peptidoglycan/xylan/chitin deacetylase (PgdA/CDA1 family)
MHFLPLLFSVSLLMSPPHLLATHRATMTASVVADYKTVAITFDDGPYGTSTQQVLSILKQEKVPATFFLIGQNVAKFPQQAQDIVAAGNEIGNHTYTHSNLATLQTPQALVDIARAQAMIASTTGIHSTLFRPPYGVLPKPLGIRLRKEGYKIVMWNNDPQDWNAASSTSQLIISRVLSHKKRHIVLLLHDGRDTKLNYPRDNMIKALPTIIDDLKKDGYVFVKL